MTNNYVKCVRYGAPEAPPGCTPVRRITEHHLHTFDDRDEAERDRVVGLGLAAERAGMVVSTFRDCGLGFRVAGVSTVLN